MPNMNQLFKVLQQLTSSAQNLNKDIDHNDSREETKGDLEQLHTGFQELKTIFNSINQEDLANAQREVQELMSGNQNFMEYARDVNAIIADVRSRTKSDTTVEKKISQNLPSKHKKAGATNFLDQLKGVLNQVNQLVGQK